jgi:hypothetical protein
MDLPVRFKALIEFREIPGSPKVTPISIEARQKINFTLKDKHYFVGIKDVTKDQLTLYTDTFLIKTGPDDPETPSPTEVKINSGQKATFYSTKNPEGPRIEMLFKSGIPVTAAPPPAKPKTALKTPKIYFSETGEIIRNIESKLGSPFLTFFLPERYTISEELPEYVYELLQGTPKQPVLNLMVVSAGGDTNASLRIAKILREFGQEIRFYIPSMCASAATQLSLSADKLYMSPHGFLTAIDTKVSHQLNPRINPADPPAYVACDAFRRVMDLLKDEDSHNPAAQNQESPLRTIFKYVHPILVGEIERISKRSVMSATKLMSMHPDTFPGGIDQITGIARHLAYDYPDHGFPILVDEAKSIGLPAEMAPAEISEMMWNLLKYYRAVTRPAETHFAENFFHVEENMLVLQSRDKMITKKYSFNRNFSPQTRRWQVTNDNTMWVKRIPSDDPKQVYTMYPIEYNPVEEKPEDNLPPANGTAAPAVAPPSEPKVNPIPDAGQLPTPLPPELTVVTPEPINPQ